MKKQQKLKEQKKTKKKQPLSFDERFKDKINVVGKLGVLDLLGLHQPFDLERAPTPILEPVGQADKNPEKEASPKRKLSYSQISKSKVKDLNFRTNKTDVLKKRQKDSEKAQKLGLPRISKSSANIHLPLDLSHKQDQSTRQYWRGKNNSHITKKRGSSQLSCLNMIKVDHEANLFFENLAKFQKINKGGKSKRKGRLELD